MDTASNHREVFLEPAFVICVVVLALAGAGMSAMTRVLGVYAKKEPLPLRKSLNAMDEQKLAPYKIIARHAIENEEVVESLGTKDYVQWVLEDPREPVTGPARKLLLFITYYDVPDRVPHVPEECYTGGGYECLEHAQVAFELGDSAHPGTIPGQFLLFRCPERGPGSQAGQFPVLYLFRVNREYAGSREDTRMALNRSIFSKHAYFSKIELAFNQTSVAPTKDQAVAASERLLKVLLPLLEQEHWPDPQDRGSSTDREGRGE